MHRGEKYFAAGDYLRASLEFRNALQIQPNDVDARLRAGEVAEKLGKLPQAVALYQSVIDAAPERVEARVNLSRLLVFGGAPERALTVIEPGLVKHPDNAQLLTYRAAARTQLNNATGAVADAERALQLAPTNEDAIAVRAGLYRRAGAMAEARTLVSGGLAKSPDSVNLRQILADLCELSGDPAGAEQQLRELVRRRPQELGQRQRLALFYVHAQPPRLDDAQRVLEEAVSAMPANDEAKLTLVQFLTAQRGRAQGEQVLRGFIARTPDNYDLRLALGELLQRSGASEEAAKVYTEVIERDGTGPKGLMARARLAAIAFVAGRYEEARRFVDQVLEKSPSDGDALLLRGQIALVKSDPAAAIADFRAVLRDQPQSIAVRRLLARAYLAHGEASLAEEALRTAVDLTPGDASLRVELAQVLLQEKRAKDAVPLLEQAARDAPTDVACRQELVRVYLTTGNLAAARAAAEDVKRLQPKSAAGFYLAGLVAEAQKQPAEARVQYEQALALEPKAFDVLSATANLERSNGHIDRAVTLVKSATEQDPANAAPINLLGELYLAQKNFPLAQATFSRAISITPAWWLPYRNLALARYATGDLEATFAAYEAGIKAAPEEVQLVSELALLYEQKGRVDDAIARYDAIYKLNPRSQFIANNLAMLLATYKSDQASLDRARDLTATFAASDDGRLLDTNGWVHFKRAEYTAALPVLERAVERAPKSPELRYHLGMAEFKAGRMDRARSDLEAALAETGQFRGASEARSTLAALKARSG
jgi:tetratricopeptide (TPR) repeat protein